MSKNEELEFDLLNRLKELARNNLFSGDYGEIPEYIKNNLQHILRDYQEEALYHYHLFQTNSEFGFDDTSMGIFHMATGSGKTDIMAALILYLYYVHGYQCFVFTTNSNSVISKTRENILNSNSDKYLFLDPIKIDNNTIRIEEVYQFPNNLEPNVIYLLIDTIQGISPRIENPKETGIGIDTFVENDIVILADEFHHFMADTRSKNESASTLSWERASQKMLRANPNNKLLGFTATIDFHKKSIYEKYGNYVIYEYGINNFIQAGYSKMIKRIQSSNSDQQNMLNAVLLSEYRRLYALEEHDVRIKPIILFKSPFIEESFEAEEKFHQLIDDLSVEKLVNFIKNQKHIDEIIERHTIDYAYGYYLELYERNDLYKVIQNIKTGFSEKRVINANDSSATELLEGGAYDALNSLERPDNLYRVVFAVAKLTEGWDVLNLYDIVRLSDSERTSNTRNATNSEAQLIGRGARYNPYKKDGYRSYKRRFSDGSKSSLLLETLHYHTINQPQYIKNLLKSLESYDLPTGLDRESKVYTVKVKPSFKNTDVWEKGKIYYNESIKIPVKYYDSITKYGIYSRDYTSLLQSSVFEVDFDYDRRISVEESTHKVPVKIDRRIINKAIARNTFYKYKNLRKFVPNVSGLSEFLWDEKWLDLKNQRFFAIVPKNVISDDLSPYKRLEILARYLKEIETKIKRGFKKERGTEKFIGYPIKEYLNDYQKSVSELDTSKPVDTLVNQVINKYPMDKEKYYVFNAAVVNKLEYDLIKSIGNRVEELGETYDSVYLIRLDESMNKGTDKIKDLTLHQFGNNVKKYRLEGFQPDFILYLENSNQQLQIYIEPKGNHLIKRDQWKEDLLRYINNHEGEIVLEDEVENVLIKGVKFFTSENPDESINQIADIALNRPFSNLSFNEEGEGTLFEISDKKDNK